MLKVTPKPIPADLKFTYHANGNYGHDKLLREYSGYEKPVKAVIPHGVFYEIDDANGRFAIYPGEADSNPKWVLNWPECRDEPWSQHKGVIPSCAPFLYALAMYDWAPSRRGTLIYPQHNTDAFEMDTDWWDFLEVVINDLPEHMKPVTVVLSWHDIDKQFHFGTLKVKCLGHVNDQDFHKKQVAMMTGAKYVLSNDIGSYTYYSLMAGCAFSLVSEPPNYRLKADEDLARIWGNADSIKSLFFDTANKHPDETAQLDYVRSLFPAGEFFETPTPEQIAAAEYYTRADCFKGPNQLYDDLVMCETPPEKRG